jgi:hypothetical protein
VATSATTVPLVYVGAQLAPHDVPPTVTVPDPLVVTVSVYVVGGVTWNTAAQARAALIVTEPSVQSASPVHPVNEYPAAGVAVSVTVVPAANVGAHPVPHATPPAVTVPDPLVVIVSAYVMGATALPWTTTERPPRAPE